MVMSSSGQPAGATAYCVIRLQQTIISSAPSCGRTPGGGSPASRKGPIPGFAHLEPRRHIPFITELDGPEAATLGTVLARVTRALREAADAEKVYVYVFGDHVPHLHFNLAPHRAGDGLRGGPGLLDPLSPDVDLAAHQAVATAVRGTLNASS